MSYKKYIWFVLSSILTLIILIRTDCIFIFELLKNILIWLFNLINNVYGIGILVVLIAFFTYAIFKKIKFNFKFFLKKIITTASIINAFILAFIPIIILSLKYLKLEESQLLKIKEILKSDHAGIITFFIMIFVSFYYFYQFLLLKKIEITTIESKKIEIIHGEIKFEEITNEEVLVIPANTHFDTIFEGVINERTMHGMAISYLVQHINLEETVKEKLQSKKKKGEEDRRKSNARREYYNFGECIELSKNIIFSAFSKLDKNDRAQIMNLSQYTIRMLKIFNNVEKIKNNRSVIIPFFGTGNINMCTQGISYQSILESLVDIILKSELNFSNDKGIKIVLYGMEDKVSLYELKNKFKIGG